MIIDIQSNFKDVQRQLDGLQKDIAASAMASALNKTIALAKTAMSVQIRKEFVMSASDVRDALTITRASATGGAIRMQASLQSPRKRGRSLNMIRFMERSTSMAESRRRGKAGTRNQLFVQIKRKGGKKAMGQAFIGNKGRTMFIRVSGTTMGSRSKYSGTKHAEQIVARQTIDVASMFNTKRVNAVVVQMLYDRFPGIFTNDVRYFTDRFNAKAA